MSQPVSFTISKGWTVTSSVELSIGNSQAAQTAIIYGKYRNVEHVSYNGVVFGREDLLSKITIDGESDIQGAQKVAGALDKVQRAIQLNTGNAMLTGKDLTIITNQ